MATKYIDSRATGTGDGSSWANAYTTIAAIPSVSAGTVFEFAPGSGPYYEAFDLTGNGSAGNPVIWNCNGCEITRKVNLSDTSVYKWTRSVLGNNIYYLTLVNGTTTGLIVGTTTSNYQCATVNGQLRIASSGSALLLYQFMAPNTITLDLQMARGDADSLGFNTFYIRCDSGNPSTQDIWASSSNYILDTTWGYHTINDAVFSYAHISLVRAKGLAWILNNCVFKYCDDSAIQSNCATSSADNYLKVNNCIFYWTGHRVVQGVGGIAQVTFDHCTGVASHIFALIASGVSAGFLLTIKNCISAYNQAGGIDNKKLDPAFLAESNNFWYPVFTESQNGLAYVSLAGWTATAATDIPASKAGDDGTAANYTAPGFVKYSEYGIDKCDFRLKDNTSGASVGGATSWTTTGRRLLDYNYTPYPDYEISMGAYQSTYTPSYPAG